MKRKLIEQKIREVIVPLLEESKTPVSVRIDYASNLELDIQIVQSRKPKSPKTILRVAFPDGTVFFGKIANDTYIAALQKIGLDKLYNEVDIKHQEVKLVDKIKLPRTGAQVLQHEVDGYYIFTNSKTSDKVKDLNVISQQLHLNLTVELVETNK